MRFSNFFIPTLKETPKDVVLKSHEYLLRGGFIQQIGSGIYNFLPLGKRVLDKISKIVKQEMDNAGANEVLLGCVTPASLWQASGRYERYGKELLRFKDRKENEFVFGPTHEETITELVKTYIKSYKQLPLHLYQIQTFLNRSRNVGIGVHTDCYNRIHTVGLIIRIIIWIRCSRCFFSCYRNNSRRKELR